MSIFNCKVTISKFLNICLQRSNYLFSLALLLLLPFQCQAAKVLDTLQRQHPRLIFPDSDIPVIKSAIASDPFLKAWYEQQLAVGEKLLSAESDVYVTTTGTGHDLLDKTRDMEGRIITLAGLYRLSGDKRFADRATQEMLTAAAFPDWDPSVFLATGEMTASLGIGYDWLYPVLSPADRATIKNAIATKGIDPWLDRIRSGEAMHHEHNNWNQVCNGGETLGALAIADEEPERARQILDHAHTAIGGIMQLFAPDGGFEEGPSYWNYATTYNVLYIAALTSALGTDFGMADAPGFSNTPDYQFQSIGPTLKFADFGDAVEDVFPSPQVFWFARRFRRPAYATLERPLILNNSLNPHVQRESSRFSMLGLMWAALPPVPGNNAQLPLAEGFSRIAQAYLRTAWNDPNAWYVGFKGGDAHASHGHLDLGSFVMDAAGQRWASDLSHDNYSLPDYFGRTGFTYYRKSTEGHNTLTVNGQNEDLDAISPLTATGSAGGTLYAVANLDQAYKGRLTSWSRGIELLDRNRALVQDEIAPAQPVDVVWNFHTFARVEIARDGRSATLTEGGATLHALIVSPAGARFSTAGTQPPQPQSPNPGLTNLIIPIRQLSGPATIAVLFTQSAGDERTTRLMPLSSWR